MDSRLLEWGLSKRDQQIAQIVALAMEDKDPVTCRHGDSVGILMAELATMIKLDANQVAKAYLAGVVHDVGKITVPVDILTKPGKLTADEFSVMKTHSEQGATLLARVYGLEEISRIARHHHERYDGGGYPEGLAGEAIPFFSRMLCVCDSYNAMTTFRGYREPRSKEDALMEIAACSGTQFDPALCRVFIRSRVSQS